MAQRSNHSNVMTKAPSALERIDPAKWGRLELVDALIRPTLEQPFNQMLAEQIGRHLNIHWVTVYRYRQRLVAQGIATAIAGRTRRFPAGASRLSAAQEAIIVRSFAVSHEARRSYA